MHVSAMEERPEDDDLVSGWDKNWKVSSFEPAVFLSSSFWFKQIRTILHMLQGNFNCEDYQEAGLFYNMMLFDHVVF